MGLIYSLIYSNFDDYAVLGMYSSEEEAENAKKRAVKYQEEKAEDSLIFHEEHSQDGIDDWKDFYSAHLKEYHENLYINKWVIDEDRFI